MRLRDVLWLPEDEFGQFVLIGSVNLGGFNPGSYRRVTERDRTHSSGETIFSLVSAKRNRTGIICMQLLSASEEGVFWNDNSAQSLTA